MHIDIWLMVSFNRLIYNANRRQLRHMITYVANLPAHVLLKHNFRNRCMKSFHYTSSLAYDYVFDLGTVLKRQL